MASQKPASDISHSTQVVPVHESKAEKQATASVASEASFLIDAFEDGDTENPKNWSNGRRWYLTMLSGLLLLNATFASSAPSAVVPQLMEEFHLTEIVGILTVSLFVCGYCVGPILWGPLSEQYGRRPIFIYPFFGYICFTLGGALAKNTASVLIFRFLGGTFAAAPQTNSGAMISDIWNAGQRGTALAVFTLAPFAGPALGPIVGGYVGEAVSWRWVFWVMTIFAAVCWIIAIISIPETYAPVLLANKARRKRKETNDDRYWAPLDRAETRLAKRLENILARPFIIMFSEPMLIVLTVYNSFMYGCIYLLFAAFPIVYERDHGLKAGPAGLMFLALPIGALFGVILYVKYYNPRYEKLALRFKPRPVPPEYRLEAALYAGPLYAISFFWFGWTSYSSISFVAPMFSGALMGFAIEFLFLSIFNYTIDAYLSVAASALASMTIIRSLFGAAFPLFATAMYEKLNPRWASTLLGFLAMLMMPIPFVLMRYGPQLRKKSKYCPYHEEDSRFNDSEPTSA